MAQVLFDHCAPLKLRRHLPGHAIDAAKDNGWEQKTNGELLDLAEDAGYVILVTADDDMRYQQDFARRKIGVVVLQDARWPRVATHASEILKAIDETGPGQITEVQCGPTKAAKQPASPRAPAHAAADLAGRRLGTPRERRRAAERTADRTADTGHGRDD